MNKISRIISATFGLLMALFFCGASAHAQGPDLTNTDWEFGTPGAVDSTIICHCTSGRPGQPFRFAFKLDAANKTIYEGTYDGKQLDREDRGMTLTRFLRTTTPEISPLTPNTAAKSWARGNTDCPHSTG
jgi:hypothetical protein